MIVPSVVLSLIAESLLRDVSAFLWEAETLVQERNSYSEEVEFETLRNMTLVHRSWTPVVQPYIWRRALLDEEKLQKCSNNSRGCGYMRELAIMMERKSNIQPIQNLVSLLRQAPNIKILYIHCGGNGHEKDTKALFDQICKQVGVESLWLIGRFKGGCGHLCRAITCLLSISELISRCSFDEDESSYDAFCPPPKSLNTVVLLPPYRYGKKYKRFADWLLGPSSKHSIKNLGISATLAICDGYCNGQLPPCGRECMGRLETLHIESRGLCCQFCSFGVNPKECLIGASNLRKLTFSLYHAVLDSAFDLPSSLCELTIHADYDLPELVSVDDSDSEWEEPSRYDIREVHESDANVATIVLKWSAQIAASGQTLSDKLLTLAVAYEGESNTNSETVAALFPKTVKACQEANMPLLLEERPSFEYSLVKYFG